jgi:hypothetical protein
MPSVSILLSKCESLGEGGGVCSRPPRRLLGRVAVLLVGEVADAADEDTGEKGMLSSCDRLTLFEGGGRVSVVGVDFAGERCAREALGSWIPSEGNDNDFRRVLYGILATILKMRWSVVVARRVRVKLKRPSKSWIWVVRLKLGLLTRSGCCE